VAAHDDPHTTWTGAGVRQAACRLYRLFFEVEDFASLLQGICDTLRQELECDRVWLVLEETASGGLICAESGLGDVFAEIKAMLSQGRKPACGRKALAEARLVDCGDCDCPLAGTERHAITAPLACPPDLTGFLVLVCDAPFAESAPGELEPLLLALGQGVAAAWNRR